jgi:hypothetical protein
LLTGGNEFATSFSNSAQSYKSLGFYATGEIYSGKHGKSLRLDGLEKALIATLESDCYTWSRICF